MKKFFVLAVVSVLALGSLPAQATIIGITSAGSLTAPDTYDWGQLGASFTVLNGPQNITSTGGEAAVVSSVGNVLERRDQSDAVQYKGWSGNFADNTKLLWDQGVGPNITLTFAHPITGAGAQINSNVFGNFTAQISAFDASNNLLGSFSESGTVTSHHDNTAIFLGLLDDTAEIKKITFNLLTVPTGENVNDFAIASVLTSGSSNVSAVPLPPSALMFLTALAGLGAMGWMRRKKMADLPL